MSGSNNAQEAEVEPDDVMSWLNKKPSDRRFDVFEASGKSDVFEGSGSSDEFEVSESATEKTYEQILEESSVAQHEEMTASCEWVKPSGGDDTVEMTASCEWVEPPGGDNTAEATASCEWVKPSNDNDAKDVGAVTPGEHSKGERFSSLEYFEDEEASLASSTFDSGKERCQMTHGMVIFFILFALVIVAIVVPVVILKGKDDGGSQNNIQSLRELLSQVALRGGAEFDDLNSYQWQALVWLADTRYLNQYSDEQKIQRWVLACVYFSTRDKASRFDRWLTNVHECTWMGVTCDDNFTSVVGLKLPQNYLKGSFPAEVSLLSSTLKQLDLYGNSLSNEGDEGHNFFEKLTGLEHLLLAYNDFVYDGIPSQFGQLSNLIEFDASYNKYSGELRGDVFQNMTVLNNLRLGGNSYSSSIPIQIGELPNLEYLHVENASVTGDLNFMEPMEKIFEMWIDQNPGLGGTIPTFIAGISSLASISVTECVLTGSLPTELGRMTDIQLIWFYSNKLTGTIPSEMGNLLDMRRLEVPDNLITGTMPDEICALKNSPGKLVVLEADCISKVECSCCTTCV